MEVSIAMSKKKLKRQDVAKPLTLLTGTGVFPLRKKGTERNKKKL